MVSRKKIMPSYSYSVQKPLQYLPLSPILDCLTASVYTFLLSKDVLSEYVPRDPHLNDFFDCPTSLVMFAADSGI